MIVTDDIDEAIAFALMSIGESPTSFSLIKYMKPEIRDILGEKIAIFQITCIPINARLGSDGYGHYMVPTFLLECVELVDLKGCHDTV